MLILAYHRVQPTPSDTLSVSTKDFERQLRWLRLAGWRAVGIDTPPPGRREFAVTFDDGYRDNHAYAAPILRRLGVPATFLISTGYLDDQRPFPWRAARMSLDDEMGFPLRRSQVRELARTGFEIGSHTVSHPHLTHLSDEQVLGELQGSKRQIEELSGRACHFMAYPFGSIDARVVEVVRRAGFSGGLVTPPKAGIPEERLARHRVGIYSHDSLFTFALKASFSYQIALRPLIWALRSRKTSSS